MSQQLDVSLGTWQWPADTNDNAMMTYLHCRELLCQQVMVQFI